MIFCKHGRNESGCLFIARSLVGDEDKKPVVQFNRSHFKVSEKKKDIKNVVPLATAAANWDQLYSISSDKLLTCRHNLAVTTSWRQFYRIVGRHSLALFFSNVCGQRKLINLLAILTHSTKNRSS